MRFKKIAVLALTFSLATGFGSESVSAFANEVVTPNTIAQEVVADAAQASDETAVNTENASNENSTQVTDSDKKETETVASVTKPKKTTAKSKKKSSSKKKTKKSSKKKYTSSELRLMASIINCEAGGESYQGKLAVGIVVMNRVSSRAFPNSIRGVVYQKGQFSPVRNGSLKKRLSQYDSKRTGSGQWKSCISAAKKVLNGERSIKYRGKAKSLKGYHFFSVQLKGARFRLGGHRFK